MGDPRKLRKKLVGPRHPYNKTRLEEEIVLMGTYGLRNKKEIWRISTQLGKYRARARASLAMTSDQRDKEMKALSGKLYKLGILNEETSSIDDILSLNIEYFHFRIDQFGQALPNNRVIVHEEDSGRTTRPAVLRGCGHHPPLLPRRRTIAEGTRHHGAALVASTNIERAPDHPCPVGHDAQPQPLAVFRAFRQTFPVVLDGQG